MGSPAAAYSGTLTYQQPRYAHVPELIASTVEDGGDVHSIINVATDVTIRILAPHAPPTA